MTEQDLQRQRDHEADLARLRGFQPIDNLMCKAMEELREESFQRGINQGRLDSIKNVMRTLKYTAQQAMDLLGIPVAEQPKYLAKL